MNPPNPQNDLDSRSPAHKRPRTAEEPEPATRLEEAYIPLYKAYRKASVNFAKAQHHHNTLNIQPLAAQTNTYIRDTGDFLHKLSQLGEIPENTLLLTIDVQSNIPHRDGLIAAKRALDKRNNPKIPTTVILKLMELVLTRTVFRLKNT